MRAFRVFRRGRRPREPLPFPTLRRAELPGGEGLASGRSFRKRVRRRRPFRREIPSLSRRGVDFPSSSARDFHCVTNAVLISRKRRFPPHPAGNCVPSCVLFAVHIARAGSSRVFPPDGPVHAASDTPRRTAPKKLFAR